MELQCICYTIVATRGPSSRWSGHREGNGPVWLHWDITQRSFYEERRCSYSS